MRYYIAHKYQGDKSNIERVGKIAKKLQTEHPEHAYFSPLHAFSFLEYNDMAYDDFIEVCYDKLVKMEVMRLDENGELQPFTE